MNAALNQTATKILFGVEKISVYNLMITSIVK